MEKLPCYQDDLYLMHHGILGMRWGIRRFQNEDGTRKNISKIARIDAKNKKKLDKARSYKEYADYLDNNYKDKSSTMRNANNTIQSAKYRKKADKLIKQIGPVSMNRILDSENKELKRQRKFREQQFKLFLDRVNELNNSPNDVRHPGL